MDRRTLLLNTAGFGFSATFLSRIARADSMADAQAIVDKYAVKADKWDGPTTGPKAQDGKTIVVLGGDMKNGGILGATKGVEEAAAAIGWNVKVIDGAGSVAGRTAAFGQAMALNPNTLSSTALTRSSRRRPWKPPRRPRSPSCRGIPRPPSARFPNWGFSPTSRPIR